MRFLVDQSGYGLANAGDAAMLQVALERTGEAQRDVLVSVPERLQLICPDATPVKVSGAQLWRQPWNVVGKGRRIIPEGLHGSARRAEVRLRNAVPRAMCRLIAHRLRNRSIDPTDMYSFIDSVLSADALIVTGGGFINDSFSTHARNVLELCELFQALDKPVALFGQGLGPLTNPRLRKLLRKVVARCAVIGLREGVVGPQLLRGLSCENEKVVITGDDAIQLALKSDSFARSMDAVGINIRVAPYSGITQAVADSVIDTVALVSRQMGVSVISIPISWNQGESDACTLSKVGDFDVNTPMLPEETVQRVGRCAVVVTASYHAAVFALAQGRPVVAISASEYYDAKLRGLAEQFCASQNSFRLIRPEVACQKASVSAVLHELIKSSQTEYDQLIARAQAQAQQGRETVTDFMNMMKNRVSLK